DAVALRQTLLLVDVHLDELELLVLGDDLVEHGRDGVAGAAPLRPEVDEHGLVAPDDLLIEGRLGYVRCHSAGPFAIGRCELIAAPLSESTSGADRRIPAAAR